MQIEPMALGSPPSSPSTPPQLNPNFLPAFLMGESQVQTPNRNANHSPSKNRSFGFKTPTSGMEQRTLHQRMFSQTPQEQSFNIANVGEKVGPPARGLFDTMEARNDSTSPQNQENRQFANSNKDIEPKRGFMSPQNNISLNRNLNDSLSKSYPFKKQTENSDTFWVTVLGFPPHAASLVITQFAQCGMITEKKFPPEGNWVNLKYSSRNEVAKALSYNGKLISNSIMVGVIPCVSSENKENSVNAPCDNSTLTSPNRARSLTQPYIMSQNTEVLSPQNVPQRSTGIVTKAMEYVFGW